MSDRTEFDGPLVDAVMMLADAAQVADGKLYVLGAGIQVLGPQPQPAALGLLIHVPWDRANISHDWKIELLDEDGIPVLHNDMPVIVELCPRTLCMNAGKVIADETTRAVLNDRVVIEAYLGEAAG